MRAILCEEQGKVNIKREMSIENVAEHFAGLNMDYRVFDDYIMARIPFLSTVAYIRIDFCGGGREIRKIGYQVQAGKTVQRQIFLSLCDEMNELFGPPIEEADYDTLCLRGPHTTVLPAAVWENRNMRAELLPVEVYGFYWLLEIIKKDINI